MLLSKAVINLAILGCFLSIAIPFSANGGHEFTISQQKRCLSPDCSTDMTFNNSKYELSKRVNPAQVVITTGNPFLRAGRTMLILWAAEDMVTLVLNLATVTPELLGVNRLIYNLPRLIGNPGNTMDYQLQLADYAYLGRYFLVFARLQMSPGITSWQEAFNLMDPQRTQSIANGQANVSRFITAAMQYMISQNLQIGYFQMAVQAVARTQTAAVNTRVVVMSLFINIDTYTP